MDKKYKLMLKEYKILTFNDRLIGMARIKLRLIPIYVN
jgi:hypothetical protein